MSVINLLQVEVTNSGDEWLEGLSRVDLESGLDLADGSIPLAAVVQSVVDAILDFEGCNGQQVNQFRNMALIAIELEILLQLL